MKNTIRFTCFLGAAAALLAQGPPPGPGGPPPGRGPMGFGMEGGPRFGMMGMAMRAPVTGAPYSGVENVQMQQTLHDGNVIQRQEQSKVYRDSQGRVRVEHTFQPPAGAANQTPRNEITIFDPVAGVVYVLNPQTNTAYKSTLPANRPPRNPPANRPNPLGAQVQTENLGTQTINGVTATGTRTTETIPAGAIGNQQPIVVVREVWTSQDLKVPVQIKTTDPRFGNTTMQLTNIVQSEPDAALFQVPPGYTVTTRPMGGMMGARRQRG